MIEIELVEHELEMAALVGVRRQIEALTRRLPDQHGYDGADGWTVHIEGACGEVAVAKVLKRYWNGSVNSFKTGGDVGEVQVRTRSKHCYDLIVRAGDRDDDVFILVTGTAPIFRVHGWIYGWDAKRPEFVQTYGNRPGAYFVKSEHLNPINVEQAVAA